MIASLKRFGRLRVLSPVRPWRFCDTSQLVPEEALRVRRVSRSASVPETDIPALCSVPMPLSRSFLFISAGSDFRVLFGLNLEPNLLSFVVHCNYFYFGFWIFLVIFWLSTPCVAHFWFSETVSELIIIIQLIIKF